MQNPIYEFKKVQKELASKIRSDKENDTYSYAFRHQHIAYCELRGKTRTQIENPREGNEPSDYFIQKIKDEWIVKIEAWRKFNEETLCSCD